MRHIRIPALLFAAFLPLYIPFRSRFLVNWDAVNFALGTHAFDLQHHQPHPPGYIGYVAVGWLLNHLTGEANASLTLLSLLSVAAAPAGFYLLASLFVRERYALASAILLGLSPIVWYYSGVALTYSVELALGLFFLWAGYLGRQRRSVGLCLSATFLLVLLGAMRPSGALFLMPMWLYMVWPLTWRNRLASGGVLVAGNLLWLVPLFWLSGGVSAFVRASRELVRLVVVPTSVFGAGGGPGPEQNLTFLAIGVLIGVNLGLLVIPAGLIARPRAFGVLWRHRTFLALWLGPSMLTYGLMHTGQLGYVLLILPVFFLLIAVAMEGIMERWHASTASRAGGAAALAAANVAMFLILPPFLWGFVPKAGAEEDPAPAATPVRRLAARLQGAGIGGNPRQFDLKMSDRYWRDLITFVEGYAPANTVLLTAPDGSGSFRHLTYYLPTYHVYGLGRDMSGRFGHLFTAFGGTSDYSLRRLRSASGELVLPATVTTVLVPDRKVQRRMNAVGADVRLDSGLAVRVVHVQPGSTLVVERGSDGTPTLRVGQPPCTAAALVDVASNENGWHPACSSSDQE